MMHRNPWKVLSEETLFSCSYFDVRQDMVSHGGRPGRAYHSLRMKHCGVCILPVDELGLVTLVGQHRYVLERYTWELPAGGAAVNADPLAIARQELKEECGYRASQWLRVIAGDVSPGTLDSTSTGYVAWDLDQGEPQPEPEESLSLRKLPFPAVVELALSGEVAGLLSVALILAVQVRATKGLFPPELSKLLR